MRLNVLGPMELVAPAGPVALGPPKQRAVLAMLAMHADRVLPVGTLVDRLWGETPPANPLANVQAYVSHLRRLLEPERTGRAQVLVSAADGYGLMTPTLALDVREMEGRLHRARDLAAGHAPRDAVAAYDAALALWRGDTYADVRTEEWAQPEIARLEELRLTAWEERAAALLDLGRTADVVTSMESLIAGHPLRERGWELLALAYVRGDRQADALSALRRVRELLAEELGLDPGPRLQELEAAILRQQVSSRPPAPTPRRAPQRPFVGRESELAILRQAAAEAAGSASVVLVDGEPGVGKSRLLERFLEEASVPTYLGRSPDHETAPPLWPWEQVVAGVAADRPDLQVTGALRSLLDRTSVAAPSYDVQGARLRLFAEVTAYLAAAAPLHVLLEDLHAADDASLRLTEHLGAESPPGVLVVATFRRHESSALTGTLARLSRLGARRLSLDGLATGEVRALLREVTGEDPGEAAAESLRARTAGNPFFLTELARAGGRVPAGVRDVVLDRVAALGDRPRAVLEAAAVVGEQPEPWLVAEVSGLPLTEVVDAFDVVEQAGLVRTAATGATVRFTHALVVDALLRARSAVWRSAAHERCAAALTRTRGHLERHHGDIARHWLAAAELGPDQAASAAEFCTRAARSAMSRNAPVDALAFWQEASAAAAMAGSRPRQLFEVRLGHAEALYAAGRFDEGYAAAVAALADAEGDPELVVRTADVCMAHGIWMPFQHGTDPVALRVALDQALAALPPDSPTWALAQGCRAMVLACTGREPLVDATSREAVTAAEALGDPALLRRTLHLRLVAMRGPDFVEERATTAARILALPDLPPALAVIADLHVACHSLETGRVAPVLDALPRIDEHAHRTRNPTLVRQVLSMRVGLAMFAGRYDEALALLDGADAAATGSDSGYFQAAEAGQRALMLFEQDRLGEVVPMLEHALEISGMSGFGYALGLGLLTGGGDRDRARALLQLPLPPRDYTWVSAVMTRLHLALRLEELTAVAECRELMRPFSGQLLVSGTGTSISGAWDSHLGEASLALGEVASARAELTAAVALLEHAGSPYWLERGRQALAKCS